jgi:glycosyltransferase involved in cell wall biosynthesis
VKLPYPGPIFVYVGRVAVEKNLEAFLDLDLPGTKLIVGGGPALETLKAQYTDAVFVGPQLGEDLAQYYAGSDVFVFPSLTDTFGIVLLEALASGLPVAAFPVTGPKDVVTDPKVGVLSNDLRDAALAALTLKREDCAAFAQNYSWHESAKAFFKHLYPLKADWSLPDYDH